MRLRHLFFAVALTTQLVAYCPGWQCGPPPGSRERYPRHDVCCENGNCRRCCPEDEGDCCPKRERQTPYTGHWYGGGCDDGCCYDACGPCTTYVCRWGGSIEISADALYWKSTRDPITVWNQTAGTPINFTRSFELNPGYDWGARLYGQWNLPCNNWFVRGGYLYLRTLDHSRIRGVNVTFPWGNLGPDSTVNAADADLTLYYQRAELVAGYNVCKTQCSRFYAYGGGFWMDILEKFKSDAHGTLQTGAVVTSRLIRRARAQGVGATVGFGGQYNVTQGLYLLGRLAGLAVAAERDFKLTIRAPAAVHENGRFEALYPSTWALFPGFEASVAARYTAGFCGLWFSGELGWEIQHYFNALRAAPGLPANAQVAFIDCGFAGPYAGLRLRF